MATIILLHHLFVAILPPLDYVIETTDRLSKLPLSLESIGR